MTSAAQVGVRSAGTFGWFDSIKTRTYIIKDQQAVLKVDLALIGYALAQTLAGRPASCL